MTYTHYKKICERHGCVIMQCRCPGPKSTQVVACPPECPGRRVDSNAGQP